MSRNFFFTRYKGTFLCDDKKDDEGGCIVLHYLKDDIWIVGWYFKFIYLFFLLLLCSITMNSKKFFFSCELQNYFIFVNEFFHQKLLDKLNSAFHCVH